MSRTETLANIELERAARRDNLDEERVEGPNLTPEDDLNAVVPDKMIITFPSGVRGSLTELPDGDPYLIAGENVTLTQNGDGSFTISSDQPEGVTLTGFDEEVQFNDGGDLGSDPTFTYNKASDTLTVSKVKGRLEQLSGGDPFLVGGDGISITTPGPTGSFTVALDGVASEDTPAWGSYTPGIIGPTLPTVRNLTGRYIVSGGTMKLLFSYSATSTAGASAGSGTYRVSLPTGFQVDTGIVPLGSSVNIEDGLAVGTGTLLGDSTFAGGLWTVIPVSATELMLVGKDVSSSSVVTWGSANGALNSAADIAVSFSATIPVTVLTSITVSWSGPLTITSGGTFTALRGPYRAGTQFVEGALSFAAGTEILLYESVFSVPGRYILFDYSAGSFPGGQAQLNSNVSVTAVDLTLSLVDPSSGIATLEDDTVNERIILKLRSRPTNGKQWVEGDLAFTGPTQIILSADLYASAETYELFEVTGTITGLQHLTCVSAAGFTCGVPFAENGIVKVVLS